MILAKAYELVAPSGGVMIWDGLMSEKVEDATVPPDTTGVKDCGSDWDHVAEVRERC